MSQIHCIIGDSSSEAHAMSPLVYRLKSILSNPSGAYSCDSPRATDAKRVEQENLQRLQDAGWALQESKLLWKKGLTGSAQSNMTELVIEPLKSVVEYFQQQKGDGSGSAVASSSSASALVGIVYGKKGGTHRSPSSSNSFITTSLNSACDLLSEALRTGGEWMSAARSAADSDIRRVSSA
jgi:hypothetical protein